MSIKCKHILRALSHERILQFQVLDYLYVIQNSSVFDTQQVNRSLDVIEELLTPWLLYRRAKEKVIKKDMQIEGLTDEFKKLLEKIDG